MLAEIHSFSFLTIGRRSYLTAAVFPAAWRGALNHSGENVGWNCRWEKEFFMARASDVRTLLLIGADHEENRRETKKVKMGKKADVRTLLLIEARREENRGEAKRAKRNLFCSFPQIELPENRITRIA